MRKQWILKSAVLTVAGLVLFAGQTLAVEVKVTLSGNQTVTASGTLTLNNVPMAGGAFNLTAPGGAATSVVLNVNAVPNDVDFNWTRPVVPDNGNCNVNLSGIGTTSDHASVGIPGCAVPAGAATSKLQINLKAAPVPSLTTYGLIILALLLAGTAAWMFRRRRVSVT